MKLKAVLALTATLTLGVAAAQGTTSTTTTTQAPTLSDVPAGHWAKDAVDRLVSQGVILGFPDGTYRGTQNLTRYQAAVIIARVLDQIAQGGTQLDPATTTSLQNAVQELAADLAALGVRVADLEENAATRDDIARIEERLNNLSVPGGDATAGAELRSQIEELTARVDELGSNYDTLRADVDDNASSIAALNDLTVLLNQDILSLQDRVSALETGKADRADVEALTGRVATIEARPVVTLTGGITSTTGNIQLTEGTAGFDIDRLTQGTFLGDSLSDNDVTAVDTANRASTADVNFGLGVSNITTANGQVAINNATLTFGIRNAFGLAPLTDEFNVTADTVVRLKTAVVNGTIAGQPFAVGYNADYSKFKFNEYLFDNDASEPDSPQFRRGVVATFQATALPLAPSFTLVSGNGTVAAVVDTNAAANANNAPYFGVRAAINPAGLGSLGLSYATGTSATGVRDAFGADLATNIGPVALDSVYVASTPRPLGLGDRDQAFYVRGSANLGFASVVANFRAIDPQFAGGDASLSRDGLQTGNNAAPFVANQFGYGAGAQANIAFVTVGAYGDYRTTYTGPGPATATGTGTNFGVNAGAANVFAGFGVRGFFNYAVNGNGTQVEQAPFADNSGRDAYAPATSATATYQGAVPAPYRFTSTAGAVLTHDGKSPNALIPNLNITLGYANFYRIGASDFQAYADYNTAFSGFTVTPFARFHLNTGGDAIINTTGADTTTPSTSYTTFKVGTQLNTTPFGVIFAPSLQSGIAYRSTSYGTGAPATSELFGRVGIVLNEFLAPGVTFGAGYSYYQGTNVAGTNGSGADLAAATAAALGGIQSGNANDAFRADRDRIFRITPGTTPFQATAGLPGTVITNPDGTTTVVPASTGNVSGFYTQLDVYGFKASYGVFFLNDSFASRASTAQGFKLGYEVKF